MATIDWESVLDKVEDALLSSDQILTKQYQSAHGGTKTYRDFKDIASLQTINKNRKALEESEDNGLLSFFEIDHTL